MAMYKENAPDIQLSNLDIGGMRQPYKSKNEIFLEDNLAPDPIAQFQQWFDVACNTPGINEANAMCLATSTKSGIPSARMVLLKGFGKDGFRFFTNYCSRKAKEMEENPHVSLCFYWDPLSRSVRIEGKIKKISEADSEEYFHSRPRGSQIGACVSQQSQVIASRSVLTEKESELSKMYADESTVIPKPTNWGGYIVVPDVIEFWQGQTTRIHDRIRFRRPSTNEVIDSAITKTSGDGWVFERLAP